MRPHKTARTVFKLQETITLFHPWETPIQKSNIFHNATIIFKVTKQGILANHHEHLQYTCLAIFFILFKIMNLLFVLTKMMTCQYKITGDIIWYDYQASQNSLRGNWVSMEDFATSY